MIRLTRLHDRKRFTLVNLSATCDLLCHENEERDRVTFDRDHPEGYVYKSPDTGHEYLMLKGLR